MKNFFQSIGGRLRAWMQGRYGQDELSWAITIAALVLVVLSWISVLQFLYIIAFALLVWSLVRCYSRNITRRQAERAAYLRLKNRVTSFFSLQKRKWKDRKTYRYFRCKQCGASLRVPVGKGTIKVTCPKCRSETIKKT